MPVTSKKVTDLLGALVRIESVSSWLAPTGPGEAKIAAFIADWLDGTRAEVEMVDVVPGRPNVLARLRGTGGGPTLCLHAHTDTVGYEAWPERALMPRVDGDRLFGLGAADDKAGCAAAMLVLRSLAESGARLRGDLLVACVADGEGRSIGTEHLTARGGIDAAIVIEPQRALDLVVEHQGFGWIDIITKGVAAHGSDPESGVDAIVHLAEVIAALHKMDRSTYQSNPSLLNGKIIFHTGTIKGGSSYVTYPKSATVGIKIGTQPLEKLSDRLAEIETVLQDIAEREPGFNAQVKVKLERDPFVARGHEALQDAITQSMREVLRREPLLNGSSVWTDAALMQAAGIPTLLLGPTGVHYHAPNEWASVKDLVRTCDILERTVRRFLA